MSKGKRRDWISGIRGKGPGVEETACDMCNYRSAAVPILTMYLLDESTAGSADRDQQYGNFVFGQTVPRYFSLVTETPSNAAKIAMSQKVMGPAPKEDSPNRSYVPKLLPNGANWISYKSRVIVSLGSKGLLRHLEGRAPKPKPPVRHAAVLPLDGTIPIQP
ncbi:hypothetical protein EDB89DRAFT_1910490 [Lactarius sanguifluus]|nr:hypothetical protein EDB89DRAFT_1910490 [Lactarius sanguifluus]